MARIKEKTWADYEFKGYQGYMGASEEALRRVVKRAAKAANQRLLRMERAGRTKGVYARTMSQLNQLGRRRFAESSGRLGKMGLSELRHEYVLLRDWLSAKTSTVQGLKEADDKRFQTARERGFKGNQEQWNTLVTKFFNEVNEKYFSSEAIYTAVTTGNADILGKIIERSKSEESKGALLLRLVKSAAGRKKAQKRKKV